MSIGMKISPSNFEMLRAKAETYKENEAALLLGYDENFKKRHFTYDEIYDNFSKSGLSIDEALPFLEQYYGFNKSVFLYHIYVHLGRNENIYDDFVQPMKRTSKEMLYRKMKSVFKEFDEKNYAHISDLNKRYNDQFEELNRDDELFPSVSNISVRTIQMLSLHNDMPQADLRDIRLFNSLRADEEMQLIVWNGDPNLYRVYSPEGETFNHKDVEKIYANNVRGEGLEAFILCDNGRSIHLQVLGVAISIYSSGFDDPKEVTDKIYDKTGIRILTPTFGECKYEVEYHGTYFDQFTFVWAIAMMSNDRYMSNIARREVNSLFWGKKADKGQKRMYFVYDPSEPDIYFTMSQFSIKFDFQLQNFRDGYPRGTGHMSISISRKRDFYMLERNLITFEKCMSLYLTRFSSVTDHLVTLGLVEKNYPRIYHRMNINDISRQLANKATRRHFRTIEMNNMQITGEHWPQVKRMLKNNSKAVIVPLEDLETYSNAGFPYWTKLHVNGEIFGVVSQTSLNIVRVTSTIQDSNEKYTEVVRLTTSINYLIGLFNVEGADYKISDVQIVSEMDGPDSLIFAICGDVKEREPFLLAAQNMPVARLTFSQSTNNIELMADKPITYEWYGYLLEDYFDINLVVFELKGLNYEIVLPRSNSAVPVLFSSLRNTMILVQHGERYYNVGISGSFVWSESDHPELFAALESMLEYISPRLTSHIQTMKYPIIEISRDENVLVLGNRTHHILGQYINQYGQSIGWNIRLGKNKSISLYGLPVRPLPVPILNNDILSKGIGKIQHLVKYLRTGGSKVLPVKYQGITWLSIDGLLFKSQSIVESDTFDSESLQQMKRNSRLLHNIILWYFIFTGPKMRVDDESIQDIYDHIEDFLAEYVTIVPGYDNYQVDVDNIRLDDKTTFKDIEQFTLNTFHLNEKVIVPNDEYLENIRYFLRRYAMTEEDAIDNIAIGGDYLRSGADFEFGDDELFLSGDSKFRTWLSSGKRAQLVITLNYMKMDQPYEILIGDKIWQAYNAQDLDMAFSIIYYRLSNPDKKLTRSIQKIQSDQRKPYYLFKVDGRKGIVDPDPETPIPNPHGNPIYILRHKKTSGTSVYKYAALFPLEGATEIK
jgi:hypothetical protein